MAERDGVQLSLNQNQTLTPNKKWQRNRIENDLFHRSYTAYTKLNLNSEPNLSSFIESGTTSWFLSIQFLLFYAEEDYLVFVVIEETEMNELYWILSVILCDIWGGNMSEKGPKMQN